MTSSLDVARLATTRFDKVGSGWCQRYVGLFLGAGQGLPSFAPGGFGSAEEARLASVKEFGALEMDPMKAEPGWLAYFRYVNSKGKNLGHVGGVVGSGFMASNTSNKAGLERDLGKFIFISSISEYGRTRTFLGCAPYQPGRGQVTGLTNSFYVPPATGGVMRVTPNSQFARVQGDGITYLEPRGELANRILRGMVAYGLDPRYNSISDGKIGPNTRKAIQRCLTAHGLYKGPIDGKLGINNMKQIQLLARAAGGYKNVVDGICRGESWNGFATAIGQ